MTVMFLSHILGYCHVEVTEGFLGILFLGTQTDSVMFCAPSVTSRAAGSKQGNI